MTEAAPVTPRLLALLGLQQADLRAADPAQAMGRVFEAFAGRVVYDTTENFLAGSLFVEPHRYEELLARGLGLSCQEQYFLLRDLLRHAGSEGRIVHGDVLDLDTGASKPLFATAVMVPSAGGFWHLDPIHRLMCRIEAGSAFALDTPAGRCAVEDRVDSYVLSWSDPAGDSVVTYHKGSDEQARIRRLRATYADPGVLPFGVVTPFYWQVGPTRKIFYDVFADRVRVIAGSARHELDLLDWDLHASSAWLDDAQKKRVFRCVSEIEFNLDQYRESMTRFLMPVAAGGAR